MRPEQEFLGCIQQQVALYRLDTRDADSERQRYAIYLLNHLINDFKHCASAQTLRAIEQLRDRLIAVRPLTTPIQRKATLGLPAPTITNPYTTQLLNGISPSALSANTAPLSSAQQAYYHRPATTRPAAQTYFKHSLPSSKDKAPV